MEGNAVHQIVEFAVFQIAEAVPPLVGEIGVSGVVFQQIDFAAVELEGVDFAFGGVDGFELIGCGRVMQQLFPVQEVMAAHMSARPMATSTRQANFTASANTMF